MKIDIWSDVMCPFCYIGKRRLENALAVFPHRDSVEIEWHSFQLDPDTKTDPDKDVYTYLAERKGQSLGWSKQAHEYVTNMAAETGLQYNFDKAVVANSFDAHRMTHLAKKYGRGDAMEEALFRGYFTEGKNTADHNVLKTMALSIGLDEAEVNEVLAGNRYAEAVNADIAEAARLRINGVPFFVVNGKYGISGAQPSETFTQALETAWKEYEREQSKLTMMGGEASACEPGGECK